MHVLTLRNWIAAENSFPHRRKEELRAQTGQQDPDMSEVRKAINRKARDNARTPMPWNGSENAGFTTGTPWMRVNEDNRACNVADQQGRDGSIWTFWKETLKLRKSTPALVGTGIARNGHTLRSFFLPVDIRDLRTEHQRQVPHRDLVQTASG